MGSNMLRLLLFKDDHLNQSTTISNIHCTSVKFFFIMNMEFHFAMYYLDITNWIPCHDWFAPEFVTFMANPGYMTQYVHNTFCTVFAKAEPHVMNPISHNDISFMGKNNDNFICKTNLRIVPLSLSQASFVWLYPFLCLSGLLVSAHFCLVCLLFRIT